MHYFSIISALFQHYSAESCNALGFSGPVHPPVNSSAPKVVHGSPSFISAQRLPKNKKEDVELVEIK